jgi:hypothetical protein
MNIKKSLLYILLIFIIFNVSFAQQKYSRYMISGGAGLNGNIDFANFKDLPGVITCCVDYKNNLGFGFSLWGGMEYIPKSQLFGFDYHFSTVISYNNLSAPFSENEFVGNIITGNTYTQGTVEHRLEPKISAVLLEPAIYLYPVDDLPFAVKVGLQAGITLGKTFTYAENLVSPANVTFENLQRVRNQQSGDLKDASSLYFAGAIGIRYEAYKTGNFIVNPELTFNYGLTNIVSGINWKISTVRAGVTVNYRIEKPEILPPLPPPLPLMPPPPEAPAPGRLDLALNISLNDKNLKEGDTIVVPVQVTEYITNNPLIPVVFYGKNETQVPLNNKNESVNLSGIVKYLNENPDEKVKITAYSIDDEDESVLDGRLENMVNYLTQNGIGKDKYKTEKIEKSSNSFSYDELRDENRKVTFLFDKNIIIPNKTTREEKIASVVNLSIEPKIQKDGQQTEFKGEIYFNNDKLDNFGESQISYTIPQKVNNSLMQSGSLNTMKFKALLTDADKQSRELSTNLYLKKDEKVVTSYQNLIQTDSAKYEQLILGYCEFDQSGFYAINKEAVEYVKQAISDGKEVEIMGFTDNLGTGEHNSNLAHLRTLAGSRLFGNQKDRAKLIEDMPSLYPNDTPYGRMLNRTAIARVLIKN